MHILSKSTYIKGLQCPKALYMTKKHPYLRDKLSIEQRAKFQRGTDVGLLAHEYFPGGIDMTPNSPTQFPRRVQETMANLSNPEVKVMYEAVFQYNDTLIMLDMLVRDGDRWLAVEVKSSMRLSDTYYNDAALQYYVLHGCQVPLSDFKLMYINGDYERNGSIDVKQLFKLESVIDFVKSYNEANEGVKIISQFILPIIFVSTPVCIGILIGLLIHHYNERTSGLYKLNLSTAMLIVYYLVLALMGAIEYGPSAISLLFSDETLGMNIAVGFGIFVSIFFIASLFRNFNNQKTSKRVLLCIGGALGIAFCISNCFVDIIYTIVNILMAIATGATVVFSFIFKEHEATTDYLNVDKFINPVSYYSVSNPHEGEKKVNQEEENEDEF